MNIPQATVLFEGFRLVSCFNFSAWSFERFMLEGLNKPSGSSCEICNRMVPALSNKQYQKICMYML